MQQLKCNHLNMLMGYEIETIELGLHSKGVSAFVPQPSFVEECQHKNGKTISFFHERNLWKLI